MDKIVKIDMESSEFPYHLKMIKNPPEQLYCLGDISLLQEKCVAVVGSRKYTVYGKNVAHLVGKKLAESGLTVVSGLAIGIDGFAHQGMLEAGGKGIAVLGSGINKMTPYRNKGLMQELLDAGGLVVSEYPPDEASTRYTFPQRNRIISGLSEAVVIVEANFNSGALITAQFANEQGRTVYAVPGNINSQFSLGSNLLIRDGATPLVVIDDIIRDTGGSINNRNRKENSLGEDEKMIIEVVKTHSGISVDELASSLGIATSKVNSIVTILEIKGEVETYSGKIHLAK